MNWSRTAVLVTGAGGFIGSHLVERLVELGARTRAFVRYSSSRSLGWLGSSPHAREIEFVFGDVRDAESVRAALEGTEVVFHLAALIGIPYSYVTPLAYLRTNVEGTMNLLLGASAANVRLLVHTSTSEVYGTARYVPIDEEHPLQAQSPYAGSKIAADKMAESFHLTFGLPVVTLRPFNTFGPRQSARAIVPTITLQALEGRPLRLGNTAPTRDLNFITDTVDAFIRAAGTPEAIGRVINVGSGREISVGDLAGAIQRVVGTDLPIVRDEDRVRPARSEVKRLVADSGRAQRILGWRSTRPLEDGLRETVEWIQEHRAGYVSDVYVI